jgi:hypothetical protein
MLALAALSGNLVSFTLQGMAMSNGSLQILKAECVSENSKFPLPEDWCALFAQRLAVAYPTRRIEREGSAGLIARLYAGHASSRRFEAGLAWIADGHETRHSPLATARMDADLDPSAIERFFDQLIAQSPAP